MLETGQANKKIKVETTTTKKPQHFKNVHNFSPGILAVNEGIDSKRQK